MNPLRTSQDGRTLAFMIVLVGLAISSRAAADDAPRAIFVMSAGGSAVRQVAAIEGFKILGSPRLSHDGKRLAFDATADGKASRLFIIDAGGKNLQDLGDGAMPNWSPDDKQLTFHTGSAGGKGTVWVQNADGKGRAELTDGVAPRWSPDGGQIAFLSNELRLFDMVESTQRELVDASESLGTTRAFDWSPDGKRLAVIAARDNSGELLLVNASPGVSKPQRRLGVDPKSTVAWSPNGKSLAIAMPDSKSKQWRLYLLNPDSNDPPVLIPGQEGDNRDPAWSPDSARLAFSSSRSSQGSPALAVAKLGGRLEFVRSHDKGGTVYDLAFTPDGRKALVGGDMANRRIQIWDVNDDQTITIPLAAIRVAVSPNGQRAACAGFPGTDIIYYLDLDDGSVIREFVRGKQTSSLQFSGDGSRLVSGGVDQTAAVFDVETAVELARFKHDARISNVAFSPDGKVVATTGADQKLNLWDVSTQKLIREIKHPAATWAVAFSADGRRLLTGTGGDLIGPVADMNVKPSADNVLRLWDVESGKLVREMKGHTHLIYSVAFSPDGRRAVSGGFDRTIRLWDVERGEELSRITGKGWTTKVVFSFDGNLVLAAGGAERPIGEKVGRWPEFPDERVRLFRIAAGD